MRKGELKLIDLGIKEELPYFVVHFLDEFLGQPLARFKYLNDALDFIETSSTEVTE